MKKVILFHLILSILIILGACFIYGGFDIIHADTSFKFVLVFYFFYINLIFIFINFSLILFE